MDPETVSIPALAQVVSQLQQNLDNATAQINNHQAALGAASQKVANLEAQLAANAQLVSNHGVPLVEENPKKNRPNSFNGKGSVSSW